MQWEIRGGVLKKHTRTHANWKLFQILGRCDLLNGMESTSIQLNFMITAQCVCVFLNSISKLCIIEFCRIFALLNLRTSEVVSLWLFDLIRLVRIWWNDSVERFSINELSWLSLLTYFIYLGSKPIKTAIGLGLFHCKKMFVWMRMWLCNYLIFFVIFGYLIVVCALNL